MKLTVVTPQGVLYNEEVDTVIVSSKSTGDFALLKDHAPLISTIDVGYLKLVKGQEYVYVVIINAALENQNNYINVMAQEAHVGKHKESALEHLNMVREERIAENRRRTIDFLKAERELKKSIKEAQASKR